MTDQTNAECKGVVAQNVVLGLACFFGVIANSILLVFSFKHRSGGLTSLTPDKLLIVNFAAVDVIACLISLPLHVRALNSDSDDLADNPVCLARFFTMFTCFAVNIMTLAAIAIDRYDAICRAPVRKITSRKVFYYLIFIWLFTLATVVPGGTGHILTGVAGQHICTRPGRDIGPVAHKGKNAMLAVVTLWIVPSLCVIFNRFYGIVKYVREYSSHLRSVLGVSGVKKEVKFTKICVAMIITYLSLWIMFAIMVILRNRSSSLPIHCAYLWAYSLAYSSFAVVPIEYMILDKRFLIVCGKRGRNLKVSNEVTSYNKDLGNVHLQRNETASTEAEFSCLNHIRTEVTTADSQSFLKAKNNFSLANNVDNSSVSHLNL